MQKTKKQLLGLAGLVAVAAMTLVAYSLPAPDAAALTGPEYAHGADCNDAEAGNECAKSADTGVDVQVQVNEGATRVEFMAPLDNSVTVEGNNAVTVSFEEANRIDFELSYTDDNGIVQTVALSSFTPTTAYGTHTFNLDLSSYGYRDFKLSAVAHGNNGATRGDTVVFSYKAVSSNVQEKPSENGDPMLGIEVSNDVTSVQVQLYDEKGNPQFVDKNGNQTPLVFNRDVMSADGKLLIQLPFEEYGIGAGNYTGVIVAYGGKDGKDIISMQNFYIKYAPVTPETPNTGSMLLKDMNISRLDYILTGVIAFAVVAAFALYLVFRKQRRA